MKLNLKSHVGLSHTQHGLGAMDLKHTTTCPLGISKSLEWLRYASSDLVSTLRFPYSKILIEMNATVRVICHVVSAVKELPVVSDLVVMAAINHSVHVLMFVWHYLQIK
jgi:hypothetical protein